MNRLIPVIGVTLALAGCATVERSSLLGAGMGGSLGLGIGAAVEKSVGSALIGLAVGATIGAGVGFLAHRHNEKNEALAKISAATGSPEKEPLLAEPEVRRVWVPEKLDGGSRYEEGHWIWVIEKPSRWRQP